MKRQLLAAITPYEDHSRQGNVREKRTCAKNSSQIHLKASLHDAYSVILLRERCEKRRNARGGGPRGEDSMEKQPAAVGQKNEAAARILALLRLLGTGEAVTREQIFTHPQLQPFYPAGAASDPDRAVARRAGRILERDLQFLRDQGYTIERERDLGGHVLYRQERRVGPGPLLTFSEVEIDGLVLLHNLFADPLGYTRGDGHQVPPPAHSPRHPFAQQVLSLVERLAAGLPEEQRRHFERWTRRPIIFFNVDTFEDYLPHRETIAALAEAIEARRPIQFAYRPLYLESGVKLYEQIDPYEIFFLEGHFYLLSYNRRKGKTVEFRIDRIQAGSLAYYGHELIGGVHRIRPIYFRYYLSGAIAQHGLSQRWLSQEVEREETYLDEEGHEGRRFLVHASAYSSFRIIKVLLGYGDQAQLIDPPDLREEMRKTVARMARSYGIALPTG